MSDANHQSENSPGSSAPSLQAGNTWMEVVRERMEGLRYGVIQNVVHDGRVTQIECTEKVRFEGARAGAETAPARGASRSA